MIQFLIKSSDDIEILFKTIPYQFIDCTYYLPNEEKISFEQAKKINDNDIFFCVDSVADMRSPFGHTFPPMDIFLQYCQKHNISKNKNYIFYDHKGIFSSPRVYFTFLAYGFDNIYVLDGGYPAFHALRKNLLVKLSDAQDNTAVRILEKPRGIFINSDYVTQAIDKKKYKIIDARPAGRFNGTALEPRSGLLSGHIPSSINLPFMDLLTENKTYKSLGDIKNIFYNLGIYDDDTLIFSCGSGITACVVAFAALMIGFKLDSIKIYDASWCEWGNGHFKVERV